MWNLVKETFESFRDEISFYLIHGWPWKKSFRQKGAKPPLAADVTRIMVVQLADIGDLMMTSVFLRELRRHFPQARILLVAAPHTALLARSCPDIDEVDIFDYRGLAGKDWLKMPTGCRAWWKAAQKLAKHRHSPPPDLAFSVRQDADPVQLASHIVMATSGARWKIGYELNPQLGEAKSSRLLDVVVPRNPQGHEVERQLHLLTQGGWTASSATPLQYWTTSETEAEVEKWNQSLKLSPDRLRIGMHLAAGHDLKRWPLKFFAEVAEWLEKEKECHILFFGDETDTEDADWVINKAGLQHGTNLTGNLPLPVTAVFMRHLHGFIGNDSGPLHMAVAAGIPVIGIYGPVNPVRYGPWKGRSRVVTQALNCSPCSLLCTFAVNHCLQNLEPSRVKQAACELFPSPQPSR